MTHVRSSSIAHMRYIKILTSWIRGFRVKIANFYHSTVSQFPEETKKAKPNIEKWPESLGVMLEQLIYRTWTIPRTTIWEPETGLDNCLCEIILIKSLFFFFVLAIDQNDFDSDWLKSITNNCKVDYNGGMKTAENPTFCPSWHSVHSWSGRHFVPNYTLKVGFFALE